MGNTSSENFAGAQARIDALEARVAALEQQLTLLRGLIEPQADSPDAEPIDLSLDYSPEEPSPAAAAVLPAATEVVIDAVEDIPATDEIVEDIPVADEIVAETKPLDVEPMAVASNSVAERDDAAANSAAGADLFGLEEKPAEKAAEKPKKAAHKSINDRAAGEKKAVIDAMADKSAWLHDIPGPEVKSLRSAIGLGDQVVYIRRLFRDDSALYQSTIDRLGGMSTLKEAVAYLSETFPEWNPASDDVYRFMMAVRRKIRK